MEDFIYSKTSHLGYIRDHRSRAGLSALTTSSPETLSIRPSIPASRQQQQQQHSAVHAFKPTPCYCTRMFRAGLRRASAVNPSTSNAAIPSHLELTLCKACRSMTHLWSTKCAQSRKAFQTKIKSNQKEIACHC